MPILRSCQTAPADMPWNSGMMVHEPHFTALRSPLQGWQHYISIVFSLDPAGYLKADHARRHIV